MEFEAALTRSYINVSTSPRLSPLVLLSLQTLSFLTWKSAFIFLFEKAIQRLASDGLSPLVRPVTQHLPAVGGLLYLNYRLQDGNQHSGNHSELHQYKIRVGSRTLFITHLPSALHSENGLLNCAGLWSSSMKICGIMLGATTFCA